MRVYRSLLRSIARFMTRCQHGQPATRFRVLQVCGDIGFHGWSHQSVIEQYAAASGSATPTIITLHLGSGCSAAAIQAGRSVDTSMGYSPLEGLWVT